MRKSVAARPPLLIVGALLTAVFTVPAAGGGTRPAHAGGSARADVEAILQGTPDAGSFGRHLRYLTAEPHQAGTPRNMELADYVRDRFVEYGLEDVRFHDTPALMTYGRAASVELVDPVALRLELAEDPHPDDPQSYLYRDPSIVPFHGYAASGDVTAEVVYANSGSPEDFEALDRLGIDVRGRIVIMRYSVPYSYRGYKVYMAESRGAAGTIIYSDPQDDGYVKGETYPTGPWGPPSKIQWGAIIYDWLGYGEPFTFHWKQQPDGSWVEGPERDRQLPNIPSVPMSYEDASEILSRLRGPVVPDGWQGGLPFTYRVGPGPVRVRMRVDNVEEIRPIRNVLGVIRGSEAPDQWVILGNHRDAWLYGAVDPSSGTAAMLEVARALGAALREGHRPRRSIVFANWDAEEQLLGGSTSWVKDHAARLRADGVVYVNVDSAASGARFNGGSTPALAGFLRDVARAVPDPDGAGSVYDAWRARSATGEAEVAMIVGATDYFAFQEHIGMSCINMSFGGPFGVYHSQYENYFWLSRIGDPGFRYSTTMARLWGVLAWRMANADVLPMRYSDYARAVLGYLEQIEEKAGPERALALDEARAAAARWLTAAEGFERALDAARAGTRQWTLAEAAGINDRLMAVERAMTDEEGLRGRPFIRHLIYAPQPTYRPSVLPRLFDAIDTGAWEELPRFEAQLVRAFDRAGGLLDEARGALP